MSRSRYEAVPQADEIIELSDPSYNYNTAIPNSPPPSFHSSQSTPAVSVSGDLDHERTFNNSTPRPIPSVIATGNSASSDAHLIMNLHRRVERLEETIGRLLLEKSESEQPLSAELIQARSARSNCCVSFPDPSALTKAERGDLLGPGSNCCVTFGGRKKHCDQTTEEGQRRGMHAVMFVRLMFVTVVITAWIAVVVWLTNRPANCNSCDYAPAAAAKVGAWTGAG